MDKGAAKTRAVLGGELDGKAQGAVVDTEGFNSRLHLGGQGLHGLAGIRGEKAVYMHEPGKAKVQRSSRGVGGGCRGRRAATVDHGAAVVNGTRAAGGGGGGIVLPAAGGAGGAVRPVDAVGAEKVTEAAGAAERVVARAGGGFREPAPKVEVIRKWWRSAVAISAAVERRCVSL